MADQSLPDLASEVIHEILSWLPVKPLHRFKCVSATWLSLISSPTFAASHFAKALQHRHVFLQRQRVLIRDSHLCRLHTLDVNYLNDLVCNEDIHVDVAAIVVGTTQLKRRRFTKFVLCANGLLLLKSYFVFYLVNPATKEHMIMPDPPQAYMSSHWLYGFGFDEVGLDYKVVRGEFRQFDVGFSVFSLKTGSWRVMEERFGYESVQCGVQGRVVNGGIHWLVWKRCDNVVSLALLSFGLADEEVGEIPLPPEFLAGFNSDVENNYFVEVVEGCLCVGKAGDFEFWMMKEYGEAKSWSKMSIPFACGEGTLSGFVRNNRHLLLNLARHRLVMYNFEDGNSRNISVGSSHKVDFVGCYLESVVSPNHYHVTDGDL